MNYYPVVIIGGGASGLMLSSLLPSSLLIEKKSRAGLKLLLTGNGQGNITHDERPQDFITHYYGKKNFVSHAIYSFPPERIQNYFRSNGVETVVRSDGKVFPSSYRSSDILTALTRERRSILTSTPVLKVKKEGSLFLTETEKGIFSSSFLVIAAGGKTYPVTGSDGDGVRFASSFGHTIVPESPALSPIRINCDTTSIEGVSISDVKLSAENHTFRGGIVFTRSGFSGPAAENMSHWIDGTREMTVSFLERFSSSALKNENGKANAVNTISKLTSLPHSLLTFLLPSLSERNNASVTKEEMREIEKTLLSWKVKATTSGMDGKAMVTKGGVDTREINSLTYESKLVPGLYFTGEVIDVDGECGGYNLSFAFASAYLVSEDIRKKI